MDTTGGFFCQTKRNAVHLRYPQLEVEGFFKDEVNHFGFRVYFMEVSGKPVLSPISRMQTMIKAVNCLITPEHDPTVNTTSLLNNDPIFIMGLSKKNMPSDLCSSNAQMTVKIGILGVAAPRMFIVGTTLPVDGRAIKALAGNSVRPKNAGDALFLAGQVDHLSIMNRLKRQENVLEALKKVDFPLILAALGNLRGAKIKYVQ